MAALFFGFPLVKGLSLGQNNGLVMLALAVGLFGAARGRWALAGVGLGVATALKVSPGLLVIYLLLRGKTRAVKSAVVTAVGARCRRGCDRSSRFALQPHEHVARVARSPRRRR